MIFPGQDSSLKTTTRPNCNQKCGTKSCTNVWRHKREEHNLIVERNTLNEKCITTDISSRNYSDDNALIEYKNGETLEVKNEIIQGLTIAFKIYYLKLWNIKFQI